MADARHWGAYMTNRAMRIAALVYVLACALTLVDAMIAHVWPEPAVTYFAWMKAQYRSSPPVVALAFASSAFGIVSTLAAVALALGFLKARHIVAISFSGVMICNGLVAYWHAPPGLVSPYQNLLGDITTLAVGIAIAASYILAAQQSTQADAPTANGSVHR